MDQDLLIRFRSGDQAARTALRNHLRAVTARVLGAPQWGFEAERRRALEVASANEAMEADAADPVGFALAAMRSAARAGLESMRQADPHAGEHPDTDILVGVAMETASRAQKMRLDKHLEDCGHCRVQLETVRHALKTAASAQRAVAPETAPTAASDVPEPMGLQAAADQAAKAEDKPKPKPKPRRRRRPEAKPKGDLPIWQTLLAVAAVGGAVWWGTQLSEEEQVWEAAALLPDERPPAQSAELYEGTPSRAIQGLANGDCRSSARQLELAYGETEDLWLRYMQGLALICSRDPAAIEPMQQVAEEMHWDELPWGFAWWYAQALVLDLEYDEALRELDQLASSEHARAADAQALADQIRSR